MNAIDQQKLDEDLARASGLADAAQFIKQGANPNAWLSNLTPGHEVTPLGFTLESGGKLPSVILMLETLAARGDVPMCSRHAAVPGEPLRKPDEGLSLFDDFAQRLATRQGLMRDDVLLSELGKMEMPPGWHLAIGRAFIERPLRQDVQDRTREDLKRFAQLLVMADFNDPAGWSQALSSGTYPYETIETLILRPDCSEDVAQIIRNARARGVHVDDFHCAHSSLDNNYFRSTPLQVAAICNKAKLAAELIEMGADVTRRFPDSEDACCPEYVGKSILDICKLNSNAQIEQMVSAALARKRISETLANAKQQAAP